jgi:ribulose-phosphate 3-epimerase
VTATLAPSIISADYRELQRQLDLVAPYSARWHVDVMDGHYVQNLTIGPMIVEAIRKASELPQDVHLMITNPDETWEWYARAGAARIAFHPSESPAPAKLLKTLDAAGIRPGIAVNPDVAVSDVEPLLDLCEWLIVMSVYPGFSGQEFIPEALPKLRELRSLRPGLDLVIDGGVNPRNAARCVEAGASVLVSASAIFGSADPAAVAEELAGIGATGPR